MAINTKENIKNLIGQIPFAAELYWLVRQQGSTIQSRFSLQKLEEVIPELVDTVSKSDVSSKTGKNVFVFSTLHYWIEHAAVHSVALAGLGHDVTLAYLPYSDWQSPVNKFDLDRQNAYAKKVLSGLNSIIKPVSFLVRNKKFNKLPDELQEAIDEVTRYDTQYTIQIEDIDPECEIYKMRLKRNRIALYAAYTWLKAKRPDVVIVPNGTIQEFGIVYRVARYLKIPVVTYEFGDQRDRIWIAQDSEIMQQKTDDMWQARKDMHISKNEMEKVQEMFQSRQRATLWENFSRLWQDTPAEGGSSVRETMGLDDRPVVLLPTNVLGDSLTLGRELFSHSMAEWISRTVQYFSGRADVQFIIRVHPGEVLTHGLAMEDVVRDVLPELPENIHLIGPTEKINTYDLVEIADLGLVYTTTVGLEMAMAGLPVIVAGKTHYRDRGFTHDPDSWVTYYKTIGRIIEDPKNNRLSKEITRLAWNYAYRFFFEFPQPYPWHLVNMWEDYKDKSLADVLSKEGLAVYGPTFDYMVGKELDWGKL